MNFYSVNFTLPQTTTQPPPGGTSSEETSAPPSSVTVVMTREALTQVDKIQQLAVELTGHRNELGAISSQATTLDDQLKKLEQDNPKLTQLLAAHGGKLSDLLATPGALGDLESLRDGLTKIDAARQSLQTSLTELNARITTLEKELAAMGATIVSTPAATAKQQAIETTTTALQAKHKELASLDPTPTNESRIKTLKDEINALEKTYTTQYQGLFGVEPKAGTIPGQTLGSPSSPMNGVQAETQAQIEDDKAYLAVSKGQQRRALRDQMAEIDSEVALFKKKFGSSWLNSPQATALAHRRAALNTMLKELEAPSDRPRYYEWRQERLSINKQILLETDPTKLEDLQLRLSACNAKISGVELRVATYQSKAQEAETGHGSASAGNSTGTGGTSQAKPADKLPWPAWLGDQATASPEARATYKALVDDITAAAANLKKVSGQVNSTFAEINRVDRTLDNLGVGTRDAMVFKDIGHAWQLSAERQVLPVVKDRQGELKALFLERAKVNTALIEIATPETKDALLSQRSAVDLKIANKEQEVLAAQKKLIEVGQTEHDRRIAIQNYILNLPTNQLTHATEGDRDAIGGYGLIPEHGLRRDIWAYNNEKYDHLLELWDFYRAEATKTLPKLELEAQYRKDSLALIAAQTVAINARIALINAQANPTTTEQNLDNLQSAVTQTEKVVVTLEYQRDANAYDKDYATDPAKYTNQTKVLAVIAAQAALTAAGPTVSPEQKLALEMALLKAKADAYRNPTK